MTYNDVIMRTGMTFGVLLIGAVVGHVSMRAEVLVTSPSEGRFAVHLPAGAEIFPSRDAALAERRPDRW